MSHSEIEKLVDGIAQALVLVDWSDLDTIDEIPEKLGDLVATLREAGLEGEAEHCNTAVKVVSQVLSGGLAPDVAQDHLNKCLNALQCCLDGDCSCDEADWPDVQENLAAPVEEVVTPPISDQKIEKNTEIDAASMVDDDIMAEFLSRQADILDDIEKELLAIEAGESQGDLEGINRFFHTLKGESALLGLSEVADLCHATEDMMHSEDLLACIDRLLEVKDWFIATFRHLRDEGPVQAPLAEMMALLVGAGESVPEITAPTEVAEQVAPPVATPVAPPVAAAPPAPVQEYKVVKYTHLNVLEGDLELLQDFIEESVEHLDASETHLLSLEADPRDVEPLNAVFRGFHTIKGLAGFIEMEHIKDLAHKAENLLDMARREELDLTGNNMDLVFESVDMMKRLIEGLATAMGGDGSLSTEDALPLLMSRLVGATEGESQVAAAVPEPVAEPDPEPVASEPVAISGFVPLGKMKKTAAAKAPAPPVAEVAKPAPAVAPTAKKTNAPTKMKEAMRVDAERLDHLIETIGELVIAESMVSQSPEIRDSVKSVKLAKDLDHLNKICRELQEIGMSLRMVPVRPVFQKMARLVRDLAKKQNRMVDFVMNGEDTELDKNVVDKIGDPLVHMVRNSVDHGIEADPAERVKLGKSERGRVELRAFHKGGNICIEIEDDGKGLNKDAIKTKAIERGLLREGEVISDRDLFMLIFEPGFSTAKEVTDISGRGVGMDVVRRNIEELRGTVEITSEVGKGSTFCIKLPLTLAIIEGMVIMVGQEHYIIPTLSVVRLIRPAQGDITHVFDKGEMLAFEGSHLPLFRLSRLFDVNDAMTNPHEAMVVVVEDEGRKIGIVADQLLGQQSIVIKSLGEAVQGTDGVAGGAIMSDGNVALILDVAGLVRVAHSTDTTIAADEIADQKKLASASVDTMIENVVTADLIEEDKVETTQPEDSPVTVDV